MSRKTIAILEMVCCAVLWSIAGIFIKMLPWNGFAVASLRSLVAFFTIGLYMLVKKIPLTVSKETLITAFFSGVTYLCFAVSNKLTTAANAIVLQFTSPVFILLINTLLFHQKLRRPDVIAVLLTLFGITLCFMDEMDGSYFWGNVVAVLTGLAMACMYVAFGNLHGDEKYSGALLGQAFTALVGAPWVFMTQPEFNSTTVLCILVLGVMQLGVSYLLYVDASKYCPPLACCLIAVIEPLLNPIWVMIFDGETPGTIAVIGSAIVVVTVTVWCILSKQEPLQEENP